MILTTSNTQDMAASSLGDFLCLYELIQSGDKEAVCEFIETNNITNEGYKNLSGGCNSPIHAAAKYGHLDVLKYLMERGLDFQHPREQSPLHVAACSNHLAVVKSLVEDHGYDVNSVNRRERETPLYEAVTHGNLDVVKYLVESGADINLRYSAGRTLVYAAAENRQTEVCEYILSLGFNEINAQDDFGYTTLFLASRYGFVELIHLLVDYGADIHTGNSSNMLPFWVATCNGNVDILQLFHSLGADPEAEYVNETTPIIKAAADGNTNVVHYLAVVLNVSLNETSSKLLSPLCVALKKGNWGTAVLLLKAGADIKGDDYRQLSKSLQECSDEKDAKRFFCDVLFKPRCLTDMCCFTIRKILGRNINTSVDCLPLPCKVISFLRLTHVSSEMVQLEILEWTIIPDHSRAGMAVCFFCAHLFYQPEFPDGTNRWKKRGLSVVPLRWNENLNGVHFNVYMTIYHGDGSVAMTVGGVEIGQGLYVKMMQIAAHELGIPLDNITVKPTTSFTNSNSRNTAGSQSTGGCALGVIQCCKQLKSLMDPVKAKMSNPTWKDLVAKCFSEGIDLSASVWPNPSDGQYDYNIYGVTCTEVEIDVLTGENQITRVDILYDCGESINPEIDVGQAEGAFVMGLGYWLTEEMIHDPTTGTNLTDGTWEYKPPLGKDIPIDFRVQLMKNHPNQKGVLGSKAVGEPPLCMAASALFAIKHAIESARKDASKDTFFPLNGPATVEAIQTACQVDTSQLVFGT